MINWSVRLTFQHDDMKNRFIAELSATEVGIKKYYSSAEMSKDDGLENHELATLLEELAKTLREN